MLFNSTKIELQNLKTGSSFEVWNITLSALPTVASSYTHRLDITSKLAIQYVKISQISYNK